MAHNLNVITKIEDFSRSQAVIYRKSGDISESRRR